MELIDFMKHYLPDYERRFEDLKWQYRGWDRELTTDVVNAWHAEHFKEAYYIFINK